MGDLAILADPAFQEMNWFKGKKDEVGWESSLGEVCCSLWDDYGVLPEPEDRMEMFVPGNDLQTLRQMGVVLEKVLDKHGADEPKACLGDKRWQEVVDQATRVLASMTRAWGYPPMPIYYRTPPEGREEWI